METRKEESEESDDGSSKIISHNRSKSYLTKTEK